jgi:hypothetical protein
MNGTGRRFSLQTFGIGLREMFLVYTWPGQEFWRMFGKVAVVL